MLYADFHSIANEKRNLIKFIIGKFIFVKTDTRKSKEKIKISYNNCWDERKYRKYIKYRIYIYHDMISTIQLIFITIQTCS